MLPPVVLEASLLQVIMPSFTFWFEFSELKASASKNISSKSSISFVTVRKNIIPLNVQIDKQENSLFFASALKLLICDCMAEAFEKYKWLE